MIKPNCDFCFKPSVGLVLSERSKLTFWRGPQWFYVCRDHLAKRQWRHA